MNKFLSIRLFVLFICFAISANSNAQIKGILKDSTDKSSVLFANVTLLKTTDSTLVTGATTNEKGEFKIKKVKDGEYIFKVSFIGYETLTKNIQVKGQMDLGTIYIKRSATMLGGFEIVEKRPLFSMDGDKTVYSVEDDPSIQGGTTTDALQNSPGVQVDAEGNITLQGVNCVEIWLNDEPSKIKSEGLKMFLENLPANALKKIEVITNPSAKYANTSGCGVINIITNTRIKKNHFISFGSGINTNYDISPKISYVWANEKLSFGIYSSFNLRNTTTSSNGYSTYFVDNIQGGKDTLYHEDRTGEQENQSYGGWISMNLDYTIDSTSEIGMWAGFDPNYQHSSTFTTRLRKDYEKITEELFETEENYFESYSNSSSFRAWGNLNARYKKDFDKEGHRLNISLTGYLSPDYQDKEYSRLYTPLSERYDNLHKRYVTNESSYSTRLNLRYTKPYSKAGEMSYGLGWDMDNDYSIYDVNHFDSTQSSFVIMDSLRSHDQKSINNTFNGFADWRHKFGSFTLKLGLSAELEDRNFIATSHYFSDDVNRVLFTMRPNIHLSYRTKSMHDFSASYSYSTSTPSSKNLSEFRYYEEESYSVGNPDLKNSITHNIGLNWSKFFMQAGYVGIRFSAKWNNNSISSPTDLIYDDYLGDYVYYTRPYNLGSSASQDMMIHGNIRLGAFANLNLFATLNHNVYEMDYIDGKHYREETTYLWGNANLWTKVWKNYQFFLNGNVRTPSKSIFGKSDYYYMMSLGVRAEFFNKRLSTSLTISDPFNWNKSENYTYAPSYHNYNSSVSDSRFISFSITLRFGKLELENKGAPSSSGR